MSLRRGWSRRRHRRHTVNAVLALERGMYTWEPGVDGDNPITGYASLVTFCQTYGVTTVLLDMYNYLGSSNYSSGNVTAVQTCIGALRAGIPGCKVYALSGDPSWTTPAVFSFVQNAIINNIQTYNAASGANKFDGVTFDCEYWTDNSQTTLNAVTGMQTIVNACVAANLGPVSLFAVYYLADETNTRPTITYNGKTQQDGKHLMDMVQATGGSTIVGTYRNTANTGGNGTIISLFQAWYDYATANTCQVHIGVETESASPSYTSFYGESKTAMEAQLTLATAAFPNYSAYRGIVVHDYSGWHGLS